MGLTRRVGVTLVVLAVFGLPPAALALQTPVPVVGANLYAMTLDSADLPDGYVFEGEAVLDAEMMADSNESLDPAALTEAGFQRYYVSSYLSEDRNARIRSYISEWASPEAATAGFELLEGDDGALVAEAELADGAAEVGEEPREVTTGTYTEEELTVTTLDTTFRQGALLVGVAVETLDESDVDAEVASDLASTLQERVAMVLGGEAPESIDLTLPDRVLDLEAQGFSIQIGYLNSAEVEALYGLSDSPLGESGSSFVTAIALAGVAEPPPLLASGATILADEDAAAEVVEQSGDLVPSLANGEQIEDAELEGADTVAALSYTSALSSGDEPDSYRIVFSVGATLGVVDVQRATTVELAEETATVLATAQAACLADGATTCELPALPVELVPGTPAA
ncbi:MAG: hypothetical protein H0W06_04300 [Chloroflexia bacterium]|nr:hypothetical protein [Chloroflexia bacterium]